MDEPKLTKKQELILMRVRNELRRCFKDDRATRHNLKDIAQEVADDIMSVSDKNGNYIDSIKVSKDGQTLEVYFKPEFIKVYHGLFSA